MNRLFSEISAYLTKLIITVQKNLNLNGKLEKLNVNPNDAGQETHAPYPFVTAVSVVFKLEHLV